MDTTTTTTKRRSGELWQPCRESSCETEPVCLDCHYCDRHCTCVDGQHIPDSSPDESWTPGYTLPSHFDLPKPVPDGLVAFACATCIPREFWLPECYDHHSGAESILYGTPEQVTEWTAALWAHYGATLGHPQAAWSALMYEVRDGYPRYHWANVVRLVGTDALIELARQHRHLMVSDPSDMHFHRYLAETAARYGLDTTPLTRCQPDRAAIWEQVRFRWARRNNAILDSRREDIMSHPMYSDPGGQIWMWTYSGFVNMSEIMAREPIGPDAEYDTERAWLLAITAGHSSYPNDTPRLDIYADGRMDVTWAGETHDVTHVSAVEMLAAAAQLERFRAAAAQAFRVREHRKRLGWAELDIPFDVVDVEGYKPAYHRYGSYERETCPVTLIGSAGERMSAWVGDSFPDPEDETPAQIIWATQSEARSWQQAGWRPS